MRGEVLYIIEMVGLGERCVVGRGRGRGFVYNRNGGVGGEVWYIIEMVGLGERPGI